MVKEKVYMGILFSPKPFHQLPFQRTLKDKPLKDE
jgi:hypothetical protein